MTPDFDMTPYGVFVWPAYAISALVIAGLVGWTLWRARRWRREVDRLERQGRDR